MATFKAEVYAHQKKSDGTYNIKIRVTHNQKKKYLSTAWYVTQSDLSRSLKLKNRTYIDLTDDLIRSYRHKCDKVGDALRMMTVEQVVDIITRDDRNAWDLDIVAYAKEHIQTLRNKGRNGTAVSYQTAINSFVKFVGRDQISIRDVTSRMINNWICWLENMPARPNRERGQRAQSSYPSQLRAIYNKARKEFNDEEAGIIRIPHYPFSRITLPRIPRTRKRAVELYQLKQIFKLPYQDPFTFGENRFNLAKDIFLLSFCLVGMNAVDLYYCTDYQDGRITYQRAKTKNRRADLAEISIKVEPEVQPLLEKYRDPSGERVFKFYKLYSSVDTFRSALNRGLKKVGAKVGVEDLEFYAARHSWATIALNDAGVDKYTIHTALNHVDESMRVTDIYIRKSFDTIDRANRAVLDLMRFSFVDSDK